MERALLILSALLLNAAFAGPRQWLQALGISRLSALPAQGLRSLERKLNRDHRSARERETRGTLLTVAVLLASLIAGVICGWLLKMDFRFAGLLILTLSLPVRPAWDIASLIRKHLKDGHIGAARHVLEGTAWRHHALMDEHALSRVAIETLAVSFSERIVAPALWYLALGLPGLFVSKAAWLLEETLVRPGNIDRSFSKTAQSLHYILHYIPSRLAALLWLAVAVFFPSIRLRDVLHPVMAGMAKEPPQVLSLTAAAAVMSLSLGGPGSLYANERWIGGGTARPTAVNIGRALYLFGLLHLLFFVLLGLFL